MQAPGFWSAPPDAPGLLPRLLAPAAVVWRLGTWLRWRLARPYRAPVPVICVGNLTAGGTGKTPLVLALADRLAAAGLAPTLLSRGYGGRRAGPHRVDPVRDTAADVGDEPLLLAQSHPVWVARDRAAGARAAVAAGARLLLLDDGAQSPHLQKDLLFITVDAEVGFGNGRLIPAGPLREPVSAGLSRADVVVLIGPQAARARCRDALPVLQGRRVIGAEIVPAPTGLDLAGIPVVAFAGIGRPSKFFETLDRAGARLVATHSFGDHAPYGDAVLRRLLREARGAGAVLVTTEKDAIRLTPAWRREVLAFPVRLVAETWAPADALLSGYGVPPSQDPDR